MTGGLWRQKNSLRRWPTQGHPLLGRPHTRRGYGSSESDTKEASGGWHLVSTQIQMTEETVKLGKQPGPGKLGIAQSTAAADRRPPTRTGHARPKTQTRGPQQQEPPARAPSEGCPRREGTQAVTWASLGNSAPGGRRESQRPPVQCRGTNPPSGSRQGPEVGGTVQGTGFSWAGCKRLKLDYG